MPLLWITYFFFLLCRPGSGSGSPNKCDEVRKLFQLTQIGAGQSLPVSPRAESDLQVCASKHLTCCTKKMEEKYQLAARRDIQNLLQTSSSSLKFLISRNVAALQGAIGACCGAIFEACGEATHGGKESHALIW
ncbi:Glypican-5 Secreted glypican-5 [Takifugu flavidus]|uniref:Glypican-5 Secreted glypican-5 n=1 Tax=Takifugu flavidus TaxID=433684 RepID=A0A5C6NP17_9TELE|nr:Glypican-5 Secreted glypican-5 [Takifugu flavidus]